MKLAVLFSGGKDSCLALHKALSEGHEVKYLLTVMPEIMESFMFHTPDFGLLEKQAEMLDIELVMITSKGEENKELEDLEELISSVKKEVDGICVGGIASNYQGSRVKKICDKLNLKFYAPLWNYSPEQIWDELLSLGFKVIITKIACEGMPKYFIGRTIDEKTLAELKKLSEKYRFRLDFEGGEAESAVLWMPEFKKEIKIKQEIESDGEYNHRIKIKKTE